MLSLWSLRGYLVLLVPFTIMEVCEAFLEELQGLQDPGLWGGLLAAVPAAWLAVRDRASHLLARALVIGLPVLLLLFHGVDSDTLAIPLALVVNLLVLVSAIVLIQQGLDKGLSQFFYSGVGLLLVLAMVRYLDLVGDYVGAAVLFLIAAGSLFAAARYWRARQQGGQGNA